MADQLFLSIANRLSEIDEASLGGESVDAVIPPPIGRVEDILKLVEDVMLPNFNQTADYKLRLIEKMYFEVNSCLDAMKLQIERDDVVRKIISEIPSIKSRLWMDAHAILKGDPAARSVHEIMICYPGFLATMIYRVAHMIFLLNIPYLPRIMTEIAHSKTGIDIHPGASIGESFCIDHGTGIVIGETSEIGNRVKIYQGVTIGAKSFSANSAGQLVRGNKRHPTIGNDCVIYAGATILGGETIIGEGSVIGGNVWITGSVPAYSKVYYNEGHTVYKNKKGSPK